MCVALSPFDGAKAANDRNLRDTRFSLKRSPCARTFSCSLAQVNETNDDNSEVCVLGRIGKCSA